MMASLADDWFASGEYTRRTRSSRYNEGSARLSESTMRIYRHTNGNSNKITEWLICLSSDFIG
jgi:hypothetical protein